MKKPWLYVFIVIVVYLLVIVIGNQIFAQFDRIAYTFSAIENALNAYIYKNKNMPSSEHELLEIGYMHIDGNIYLFHSFESMSDAKKWIRVYYYDFFDIAYGIDLSQVEQRGRRLYKLDSNEQILLIDGPCNFIFNDMYENISLNWYKLATDNEYREKRQPSLNSSDTEK